MMPSCTIIIPTHNRPTLLKRAVRSALAACPQDGEVLVVDDKSDVPAAQALEDLNDARLKVTVNSGDSGAAGARNWGASLALGQVLFFLDDDDEMLPHYCNKVLAEAGPSSQADWGFASIIVRSGIHAPSDALRIRRRLVDGLTHAQEPSRHLIAAMSDGLWVRKSLFWKVGALDIQQTIDEDTDLCVRLLAGGNFPWYEVDPGSVVYRGYTADIKVAPQITVATAAPQGLACYRRTHDKNAAQYSPFSAMRWYLATRYLRRSVKLGMTRDAIAFALQQKIRSWSLVLLAYAVVKRIVRR